MEKEVKKEDHEGVVTISAVEKANEKLIQLGNISKLSAVITGLATVDFTIKAWHSGRLYQLKMSEQDIKEAYAKSLETIIHK